MTKERLEKIVGLLFDLVVEQAVDIHMLRFAMEFHRLASGPAETPDNYRAERRRSVDLTYAELTMAAAGCFTRSIRSWQSSPAT